MRYFLRVTTIYVDKGKNVLQIASKLLQLKKLENYESRFIGLADFNVPRGGFFLWIKVPGIKNTWKMMQRGVKEGVIMTPGAAFARDSTKCSNAIRASFTKASYEEMDLVFKISVFIYIFIYLYITHVNLFYIYQYYILYIHPQNIPS